MGSLSMLVRVRHFKEHSLLKRACSHQDSHRLGRYSELQLGCGADCLILLQDRPGS
jgi:hypothetical protein